MIGDGFGSNTKSELGGGKLKVECSVCSHIGNVRNNNEDNYYANGRWRRDVNENQTKIEYFVERKRLLGAVFDGMGGTAKGEFASLEAAKKLNQNCETSFDYLVNHYISEANRALCDMMEELRVGRIGTTMALVDICQNKLNICNLGDSPIFLFRDGTLQQLSVDHTEAQRMVDMGFMTAEEQRIKMKKSPLTQHLGIFEDELVIEPYVQRGISLHRKDIVLVCSDGLTDMLSQEEIASILEGADTLDWILKNLVDAALEHGGRDNITVLLARVMSKWV
jgi:protein phosphatase